MDNDIVPYIVQSAKDRHIDPATAVRVFQSEGASAYTGDQGSSFGPFQLHVGGIAGGGNAVPGLGDDFMRDTGLDPRDSATVKPQVDYALDHVAQNGWGAFHGAKRAGVGEFQGVPKDPNAANMDLIQQYMKPKAGAAAAAPSTALDPDTQALINAYMKPQPAPAAPAAVPGAPLRYMPPPGAPSGTPHLGLDAQGNTILLPPLTAEQKAAPPVNESFDPTAPISQQLGVAGRQTAGYIAGQAAGVPGVIANQFTGGLGLATSGLHDIAAGNVGTGLLKAGAGAAGAVTAPITGVVQKAVEEPVTQYTGNPIAGQVAGLAANIFAPSIAANALSKVAGIAGNVTIGRLDPETAQLATLARDKYGIPLNVPQMSPSPATKFAGSTLNRLPFSGAEADAATQQSAFNRGVAGTIGEYNATKLTPDVMSAAKDRIGNMFDRVARSTTVRADAPFQNDLQNTLIAAHHELADTEAKPLDAIFDNIISKIDANGNIDGATYQALTRKGTPLSRAQDNPNPNISFYAGEIRDTLDAAMQRSAPPEMQSALTDARAQWRALKTIEPLAAKAPTGDISPALLQGRVNQNTGHAIAYGGGGDLGELARIGQRFLKEPPSSGTAERTNLLQSLGTLGAGALGLQHFGVEPLYSLAAIPAGRAVGAGLRSNALARALIARSLPQAPSGLSLPLMALGAAGYRPGNALAP